MLLKLDRNSFSEFEKAIEYEWLETNGLGGWSGSSVIGANTRRYHGILIAATHPPAERMNLLSKLDETVIVNNRRYELATNVYPNSTVHPKGYHYLTQFSKSLFPEWIYEIEGIKIRKRICMLHGENTVIIQYKVLKAAGSFDMELLPLFSVRGYHALVHANVSLNTHAAFENDTLEFKPYEGAPAIYIHLPGGNYQHHPAWYYRFQYPVEQYRGLDYEEDLFNPGMLSAGLNEGDELNTIISTAGTTGRNAAKLVDKEKQRREHLLKEPFNNSLEHILGLAADQFIVKRDEELKTVIAGYHWFTDWGRDTMISLPGLTLSTGRFEDSRKILAAFAKSVSMGMLPNRFQDNNEPPEYNNVDGTLWYFIAIYKYLQSTNDYDFVLNGLLPVLKDIIDWHFRGTRYNIHVDEDGLLFAGEKGEQLTWMDARIGTWVVTPRMGKPVEIQALWYNALLIFAELLEKNNRTNDAELVRWSAGKCKQSFLNQFWYQEGGYLYDVIDENGKKDATLRPNQLLAISLPFSLIEGEDAISILKNIEEQLYTPVGLRSLSPTDKYYVPVYGGDTWHRDSAYHQGTVWSWLLGPYIDAIVKTENGETGKATEILNKFSHHFNEACIGTVSEIFDAEPPHHPRGCVAQAWGVAELLRVFKEYRLSNLS